MSPSPETDHTAGMEPPRFTEGPSASDIAAEVVKALRTPKPTTRTPNPIDPSINARLAAWSEGSPPRGWHDPEPHIEPEAVVADTESMDRKQQKSRFYEQLGRGAIAHIFREKPTDGTPEDPRVPAKGPRQRRAARRITRTAQQAREERDITEMREAARTSRTETPKFTNVTREWLRDERKTLKLRLKSGELSRLEYEEALHHLPHHANGAFHGSVRRVRDGERIQNPPEKNIARSRSKVDRTAGDIRRKTQRKAR